MQNTRHFGRIALILIMMAATVCIWGQKPKQDEEFDSDIVESVFRFQITKCAERTLVSVFLLSVQGKDPSDKFMKRFVDQGPRVKKKSALGRSESINEFIDKESGEAAVLLSINKLKLIGQNEAEVAGSCGFADWAGQGYEYSLIREDKGWIVKQAKLFSAW